MNKPRNQLLKFFWLSLLDFYEKKKKKKKSKGTLRKKCLYLEFFWSVFSRIRTEYRLEMLQIWTQW